MKTLRRSEFARIAFWASVVGLGLLVTSMALGALAIGPAVNPDAKPAGIPHWIEIAGGAGGFLFVSGAFWLWIRAIALRLKEYREGHHAASIRLLLAVVGTIYAAYAFYFLDRRTDA